MTVTAGHDRTPTRATIRETAAAVAADRAVRP